LTVTHSTQKHPESMRDVFLFERQARQQGYRCIAGLDEAGRGALAGPVVASAVVLQPEQHLSGVDDSKSISESNRKRLYTLIRQSAPAASVGLAGNDEIDEINILEATRLAMSRALDRLPVNPDCMLMDALTIPDIDVYQIPIVSGDRLSHSIAAASILAKVVRDRIMTGWHVRYPQYNWLKNKGYGTSEHLAAIRRFGPSPIHRMTFRGVVTYPGLFD
jgi:ribonuclease HII